MTCIVALAAPSGVLMGCDSLVRFGGTALDCPVPKIFERGELLIGTSGTRRHGELLHYSLEVPTLPALSGNGARAQEEQAELDAYMSKDFAEAVRQLFKASGALIAAGDELKHGELFDGSAIIGVRGSIYVLAGTFSCTRQRDFFAIGSGMDFALAALHLSRDLSPRVRVLRALECAAHFAQGVRGPFHILPPEHR